ncbi:hypothetical protein HG531_002317 [Fusarium graminearum]|nr:hypothetical protein HG531_002317 [Fusarium graminearum]
MLYLLLGGHRDISLLSDGISALPQSRNSLELSVEVDTRLSVECVGTATGNGLLVTGEREHGQGDRDRNIDTNLTGLNVLAEDLSSGARPGEDSSTVTVLVLVDEVDSIFNGLGVEADKNGTKYFLLVAGHVRGNIGDDGRSNPVAVGVLAGLEATAVEKNSSALLLSGINELLNALLALRGNDRAEIGSLLETAVDIEVLGLLSNVVEPLLGLTDHDEGAQGHAALTGSTESSTNDGVDKLVLVGISAVSTMDDVNNTGRETGLLDKLSNNHGSARVTLGGLKNNSSRGLLKDEVLTEGADSSSNTQGLAVGSGLHILSDLEDLTLEELRGGNGSFGDLETSENVTLGISKSLALLKSNAGSEAVPVLTNKLNEPEHDLLALDGSLHLGIGHLGDASDELIGSRIVQVNVFIGRRGNELVVDEVGGIDNLNLCVRGRIAAGSGSQCSRHRLKLLGRGMNAPGSDMGWAAGGFSVFSLRLAAGGALVDLTLNLLSTGGAGLGGLVLDLLGLVEEDSNETGGSEDDGGEATGDLGNELNSLDGVLSSNGLEEVKLLGNVVNRVFHEVQVAGGSGLVILLRLVSLGEGLLDRVLDTEGLLSELVSILNGVADVNVVKEDVVLHGPDLEANSSHGLKVGRGLVLEVVGVLDLAGSPGALVGRVLDVRSGPLALVVRVALHGLGPGATARGIGTLGVGNSRCNPVTIFLIIPVIGLLSLGVRNGNGLLLEPVLRLGSLLVNDLEGGFLIPVLGLLGLRVRDTGLVNPVLGLLIIGVVNLGGGVDGRGEVLQEAASLDFLVVLLNGIGVVGVDDQSVKLCGLSDLGRRGRLQVLLLILAGLGVLMVENEVNLVGVATLVRTEHDHVGGCVGELLLVKSLVVAKELHLDLVLNNKSLALVVNLLGELGGDSVVSGGVLDNKTLIAVNSLVLDRLLNGPLADVCPLLLRAGRILLCVRGLPSLVPVVGELFKEVSLELMSEFPVLEENKEFQE